MAKIEGEQPNCHFTIDKGDAGDAAPSRLFFEPQVQKQNKTLQTYHKTLK
jgi:hypothetical protein